MKLQLIENALQTLETSKNWQEYKTEVEQLMELKERFLTEEKEINEVGSKREINQMSTQEWLDSDPEGMKIMIQDKLKELFEERQALLQEIRENNKKYLLEEEGWIYDLIAELGNENFKKTQRQINKFLWMKNYLEKGQGVEQGINDSDIEQAREVPILSLIGVPIQNAGGYKKKIICPLHQEKTASLIIYESNNTWWCFGCNKGGSVIDWVMQNEGVTFLEAVKILMN